MLAKPKEFQNFEVTDNGLIYLKLNEQHLLCIPDIIVNTCGVRELVIDEAHSVLAHLGYRKTLSYLRSHVWWKLMAGDVEKFCKLCATCARVKPSNQKPFRMLHPLGPPSYLWEVIGIDFMGPLPPSKNRDSTFNMLTVIVDHLTGMVHLVPSGSTYKAKDVAELVFAEVFLS